MSKAALLSSAGSDSDTYERAVGANQFPQYFSRFASWTSAHGSTLNGEYDEAAFNLAQPKYMIIGFMVTIVLMGIMAFVSFDSEAYNHPFYKMLIFLTPLGLFIASWIFQYFSNMSKDNTFRDILGYGLTAKKEPLNVNTV